MFRIPSFYVDTPKWDDAVTTIKGLGDGNLLGGMEKMNTIWNTHCTLDTEMDDDDFFDVWVYEVNAYNVVFEGMCKLFAEKA